eukprot:scaffold610_cov352-Pavlova_lutheri.AAC.12
MDVATTPWMPSIRSWTLHVRPCHSNAMERKGGMGHPIPLCQVRAGAGSCGEPSRNRTSSMVVQERKKWMRMEWIAKGWTVALDLVESGRSMYMSLPGRGQG